MNNTQLFVPPLTMPIKYRGFKGAIGYQRNRDVSNGRFARLSVHGGVDLSTDLTGIAEPVFAVTWGRVISVSAMDPNGSIPDFRITLLHKPYEAGILSNYWHLADANVQVGDEVNSGSLLGHVEPQNPPPHLHFELRKLIDSATSSPNPQSIDASVAIDPTQLLYRFEAFGWPTETLVNPANGIREESEFVRDRTGWHKITRKRVLRWNRNSWLFEVELAQQSGKEYFYLPIDIAFPHEIAMRNVLDSAFADLRQVRLRWRHSYFYASKNDAEQRYDPIKMIEDVTIIP